MVMNLVYNRNIEEVKELNNYLPWTPEVGQGVGWSGFYVHEPDCFLHPCPGVLSYKMLRLLVLCAFTKHLLLRFTFVLLEIWFRNPRNTVIGRFCAQLRPHLRDFVAT